ncbi:MAG: hypothetical protein ACE5GX_08050 [Thermoanaerobaculia bacterium]
MRRISLALALLALAVAAVPATASTFLAMSDVELVTGADAIVQGRIISQRSLWDETGRVIVTESVVRVQSVLAGQAPRFVTVRTAGGEVGDFAVDAVGFPKFNDRERVVLFLEDNRDGTSRVLGYQQGHFEVVKRQDGVRMAVPRTEDGAEFVNRAGQLKGERPSMLLSDFKRGVRRIARERRGQISR